MSKLGLMPRSLIVNIKDIPLRFSESSFFYDLFFYL